MKAVYQFESIYKRANPIYGNGNRDGYKEADTMLREGGIDRAMCAFEKLKVNYPPT